MANADVAFGFEATGIMYGLQPYSVDASNGTAIFRNDIIMMESDGNVAPATAGNTQLIGAVVGNTAATTAQKALVAASTAATILVHDHPNQRYYAQDDGDSGTPAQTNVGNNTDHVAGAGSTTTGLSGHELDASGYGATAAGFRVLDFMLRDDNAVGVNAIQLCEINEHFLKTTSGV